MSCWYTKMILPKNWKKLKNENTLSKQWEHKDNFLVCITFLKKDSLCLNTNWSNKIAKPCCFSIKGYFFTCLSFPRCMCGKVRRLLAEETTRSLKRKKNLKVDLQLQIRSMRQKRGSKGLGSFTIWLHLGFMLSESQKSRVLWRHLLSLL